LVLSVSASASAPPSPPPTSRALTVAAGEDAENCNADVDRNVDVASLPTWTALWKHLAKKRPPEPGDHLPDRPSDDAGVRGALQVGDCPRACTVIWPPDGLRVPAAYLVVVGPRGGLQLYDPRAEALIGQCNASAPVATVKGVAPIVHASFAVETSSSTRVCLTDGGILVPQGEGMDDWDCQSACLGREWTEIDLFVGARGRAVRVSREGREVGGEERIAKLSREGDTLVLRGKGCSRRIPLDEDAGR
jgi:hypothetical protein